MPVPARFIAKWRAGMGLEYTTLVAIPPRIARRPTIRSRSRIDRTVTV